jgi:hypothetical protein
VAHDAGQQTGVRAGAELVMLDWVVARGFNRLPVRDPERVDAALLVEDLCDVTASGEDGHAQGFVLDAYGFAMFKDTVWHDDISKEGRG